MKYRVFLIEDNDDHVYLFRILLREHPAVGEIGVFADAESALDSLFLCRVKPEGSIPDFLILDLKLPGMSGMDLLAYLRGQPETRELPVFILTSSDRRQDRLQAKEMGVLAYYIKPLTDADVFEMVDIVRARRGINEGGG